MFYLSMKNLNLQELSQYNKIKQTNTASQLPENIHPATREYTVFSLVTFQ